MSDAKKVELLERKIMREKRAREEAERLLEEKSRELFETNQRLLNMNSGLEQRIVDRTIELNQLASFPRENPSPIMRVSRTGEFLFKNGIAKALLKEYELDCEDASVVFGMSFETVYARGKACNFDLLLGKVVFNFRIVPVEGAFYLNVYGRDVTNERMFVRELEEERDRANRASQAKSQFLANMSHEIRTPLNGMLGFIQVLKKSNLNAEQYKQLQTVGSSGEILLNLINDILEFSRIEAGHLDIHLEELNMRDLVKNLVEIMAVKAHEKNLEIPVRINRNVAQIVKADGGRIRQILLNLIGNAIKFTHFGEISLQATVEAERLIFTVRDTGIGIPEDKVESIFQSFSQTDESDTRKYGGTGLGLTISKKIVEALGGEISVNSIEAKGSTFQFWIPYIPVQEFSPLRIQGNPIVNLCVNNRTQKENYEKDLSIRGVTVRILSRAELISLKSVSPEEFFVVDSDIISSCRETELGPICKQVNREKWAVIYRLGEEVKESVDATYISRPLQADELTKWMNNGVDKKVTPVEKQSPGGSLRVLIVDDNMTNQLLMETVLLAEGYATETAENGEVAVEKFKEGSFDVVLMDLQMPIMDGFQATERIRNMESGKNIPVIAMTANAFRSTQEKCLNAGMTDFITKPFKEEELFAMFSKHFCAA